MVGSIVSTIERANPASVAGNIARCDSIGELLDLVPAPYRPSMQDLVNGLYRAAIKANNARSYLANLEKHKQQSTFPTEIDGRVHSPSIQISKEFNSSAEWRTLQKKMDDSILAAKKELLTQAIAIKQQELAHLQSLFAEREYVHKVSGITGEVHGTLLADAGVRPAQDGTFSQKDVPEWIAADHAVMKTMGKAICSRTIALAYAVVSRETAKKMRGLTLKTSSDGDVEMMDSNQRLENVDKLVTRKVEQLLREFKNSNNGTSLPSLCYQLAKDVADPNCRKEAEGEEVPQPEPKLKARVFEQGHETRRQQKEKRKREWEERVEREVKQLRRAWGGDASCSRLSRYGLHVENTEATSQFLSKHLELFCSVSGAARTQFVMSLSPLGVIMPGHDASSGIFMGPGVVVPPLIEHQLALNLKFIFHHNPNPLRVHLAWPQLERSVRIAWHFRHSHREQSKFYVPRKTWMPDPEQWDPAIEEGLRRGKDLLFERTADLTLAGTHRPNPDLRQLKSFLESNRILMKITDKNLGVAAISKDWYLEQCGALLSDAAVYRRVSSDYVQGIQQDAIQQVTDILYRYDFADSVRDFLLSSDEDSAIPEFHAIPKVHKAQWKLRPIVPSHSWATRKASEICDFVLRALHRQHMPWIVDSTREVIRQVESHTILRTDNVWIVTGDVESFYTNVDVQATVDGIRRVQSVLTKDGGVDPNCAADLADVVMGHNCFGFGEEYFHQTQGVAMGTACAPAFANVNLGLREYEVDEIFDVDVGRDRGLALYNRYIDDILLIFQGTRADLQSFLDQLSSKFEPFRIDWQVHSTREPVSFLDIEFFFEQGLRPMGLQTRVFRKRMNKHQYIPWSSAHPLSVKRAFVKAELTRFMVISSDRRLFEERVLEFMQALGRRGYPTDTLRVWKKQVKYEDRSHSLSKVKDVSRGLPLMLPSEYDEVWEYVDLKEVFETMQRSWMKTKEPLPPSLQGPLIKSLRRTDNLFDKLSSWNKAILRGAGGLGSGPVSASAKS
jgi:hypothetical protein